jgi:hypothetical protein
MAKCLSIYKRFDQSQRDADADHDRRDPGYSDLSYVDSEGRLVFHRVKNPVHTRLMSDDHYTNWEVKETDGYLPDDKAVIQVLINGEASEVDIVKALKKTTEEMEVGGIFAFFSFIWDLSIFLGICYLAYSALRALHG